MSVFTLMKTALHVRVSTSEQSTENQLPDLEALASRRGFDIITTFSENVSAVKARPEFEKMISAAHRGKFEVLLVWSLDRLHASLRERISRKRSESASRTPMHLFATDGTHR